MTGLTNRHTFERGFHLTFVVACRLADQAARSIRESAKQSHMKGWPCR